MRPPRVATWLLLKLCVSPDVEAIAGDLEEQFPTRSPLWYWREACFAVLQSAVHHLCRHWTLSLRAICVGGAVMALATMAFRNLAYVILGRVLPPPVSPSSLPVVFMTVGAPSFIAGWAIGRWHRPYSFPFAIALAAVAVPLHVLPRLVFLIVNSFQHERFLPYLWGHLARAPLVAVLIGTGIVSGALVADRALRVRPIERRKLFTQ